MDSHDFELLGKGTYSTNCLTEVHFLRSSHFSRVFLVTGATDGYVAFWPLEWISHNDIDGYKIIKPLSSTGDVSTATHSIKWQTHYAVHTSSIKTLEIEEISPGFHILVSGGDDDSLSATLVQEEDSSRVHVVSSVSVSNAHASAITAVKILTTSTSNGMTTLEIASSGNDQRVKLWRIVVKRDLEGDGMISSISLQTDRYCPVADIAAMDVMEVADATGIAKTGLVVCGVGISILGVPT